MLPGIAAIERLEEALELAVGDSGAIEELFLAHVSSNFLHRFVRDELGHLAIDPDHIVRKNAGQSSFTLINSANFDYTIRLSPPFVWHPHGLKWLGEKQIISAKGSKAASIRVFTVSHDINYFEPGVQLKEAELVRLEHGSYFRTRTSSCILDIFEVEAPMIFELLTIHDKNVELRWNFDEALTSTYAESAKVRSPRLQNILELALKMKAPVPDAVYAAILSEGNSQEKLLAIRSLLLTDSEAGFHALQEAIDCDNLLLSTGAQLLLDGVITPE